MTAELEDIKAELRAVRSAFKRIEQQVKAVKRAATPRRKGLTLAYLALATPWQAHKAILRACQMRADPAKCGNRVEEYLRLRRRGLTYETIGRMMNVTRSAVCIAIIRAQRAGALA